jgi:hypothetical protein
MPNGHTMHNVARISKPQLWVGFTIIFAVLIGLFVLFWATGGAFYGPHWVAFYVTIALVTGVCFWTLCPEGDSTYANRTLGIKLGGGAAIGASFMMLAHSITPVDLPDVRVIKVPSIGISSEIIPDGNSLEIRAVKRIPESPFEFVVWFGDHENSGVLNFHYLAKDGTIKRFELSVGRIGPIGPIKALP